MAHRLPGLLAAGLLLAAAQPVLAHDHDTPVQAVTGPGTWSGSWQGGNWQGGSWQGGTWQGQWVPGGYGYGYGPAPVEADPRYREMDERCRNYGKRDNGVGGAVIGGVVGGVVGNRIAPGDRTLGTVAGAAVGAIAGRAIDKAEDRKREQARDRECEEFLARSGGAYAPPPGYGYPGTAYPGYAVPMGYAVMGYMMVPVVPVAVAQAVQPPCTETKTVTYEYVTVRNRKVWYRPASRPIKRVKEKRVYTGS